MQEIPVFVAENVPAFVIAPVGFNVWSLLHLNLTDLETLNEALLDDTGAVPTYLPITLVCDVRV